LRGNQNHVETNILSLPLFNNHFEVRIWNVDNSK
jgi:hypothetical protein